MFKMYSKVKSYSKFVFYLATLTLLIFCQSHPQNNGISEQDKKQIRHISKAYTGGWLENDTSRVINLFADSATIVPSGLLPKTGKEAIFEFWWPNDGSKTKVTSYKIDIMEIGGNDQLAYSYENGHLSFIYEKGDFKMERDSESYAVTIYKKNDSGNWKIIKRIWSDLHN